MRERSIRWLTGVLDQGERALPGGTAGARAAATGSNEDSPRAPPCGSAGAVTVAMGSLDDGEHAPSGGSAGANARATATEGLDDCERAPPSGATKAGAAATVARGWRARRHATRGLRRCQSAVMGTLAPSAGARAAAKVVCDDGEYAPSGAGELIAMSRERVAKRRSDSNHVTGTAGWPAGRRGSR